ncbi:MAG TPA: hypothetical protein VK607_10720 [Kofleriaceae bacterium]|nr:hypothetical protein [Kofleriaceae bacterium]
MSILRDTLRSSIAPPSDFVSVRGGSDGVPIGVTALVSTTASTANQTTYTTGSFTLAAGQLGIMAVLSAKTGGPDAPTFGGSLGGTWDQIASQAVDADRMLRLYRSQQATPRTGTVQIIHATACESEAHAIYGFDNVAQGSNGASAIAQSRVGTVTGATSLTIAGMTAFESGAALGVAAVATNTNAPISAVAPYTQLSQAGQTLLDLRLQLASALGSNNPGFTTVGSTNKAAIAVEVRAA